MSLRNVADLSLKVGSRIFKQRALNIGSNHILILVERKIFNHKVEIIIN